MGPLPYTEVYGECVLVMKRHILQKYGGETTGIVKVVEMRGIEPLTSALRTPRSPI